MNDSLLELARSEFLRFSLSTFSILMQWFHGSMVSGPTLQCFYFYQYGTLKSQHAVMGFLGSRFRVLVVDDRATL